MCWGWGTLSSPLTELGLGQAEGKKVPGSQQTRDAHLGCDAVSLPFPSWACPSSQGPINTPLSPLKPGAMGKQTEDCGHDWGEESTHSINAPEMP